MTLQQLVNLVARTPHNLADMVDVRQALAGLTRGQQDALVMSARRALLLTGSDYEARYGLTPAQQAARLPDGTGFLSVREAY